MLGLHCYAWAFSSWGEWGLFFLVVVRFLIAVTSLVADRAQALGVQASAVVAHGLSCSSMCDCPRPRIEPVSPALQGKLLSPGPPAKPF